MELGPSTMQRLAGRQQRAGRSTKTTGPPIHTLYGVVIHGAIATGDLVRMKEIAAKAEQFVAQAPDVQKALDAIKAEIAKAGA